MRSAHAYRFAAWVLCAGVACATQAPPVASAPQTPVKPAGAVAGAADEPATDPAPYSFYGFANVDPKDDALLGPPDPWPRCRANLRHAGITFATGHLPITVSANGLTCGAEEVVFYIKGVSNISYNIAPLVTCGLALAIAEYEQLVNQVAREVYGIPVTRIEQLGTFTCREVVGKLGLSSEHSYANALDIGRFVLADGTRISVLRDFERNEPPTTAAGRFLRAVSRRAYDENYFSVVLTPFFNEAHHDHLHLDLGRFRLDGTRPKSSTP